VTEEEKLAAQFEIQRQYLHGIAFRMLGSHAAADDAVQEAWLRLACTDAGSIEDLRGWLTTVTGRIYLDALRRRGVRGEQPLELHVGMPGWDTAADSGNQIRASERAGTPGTRGWHPWRSRYRWWTTTHRHGLLGERRYRHRDPRPDCTNPTGPGRPLVGCVTG
jgi:hypothetical protein